MNPFDLPCREFLVFYLGLATVAMGVTHYWRLSLESGSLPRSSTTDPYLIAYLRGGANEALRVVVMSLVDRGLLVPKVRRQWFWKSAQPSLQAEANAERRVSRALERAILREFASPAVAHSIFSRPAATTACELLGGELRRHGLLPDVKQIMTRVFLGIGCAALLCWVASTKIDIAAARGQHDVLSLQLLQYAVLFAIPLVLRSRTTTAGSRLLRDLRTLFLRLHGGSRVLPTASASNDWGFLMGVFGMEALSHSGLARAKALFPGAAARHQLDRTRSSDASACGDPWFSAPSCSSSGEGGDCSGSSGDDGS